MAIDPAQIYKEIRTSDGRRIVLLHWEGQPSTFRNLLCLGTDGAVIWTAVPPHPLEGVWSDLKLKDGRADAYNLAGHRDLIDIDTGQVIGRVSSNELARVSIDKRQTTA